MQQITKKIKILKYDLYVNPKKDKKPIPTIMQITPSKANIIIIYNMKDKMLNLINIFSFFILTNSHKFLYQIIHKYSFKVTYSNITI